MSLGDYAYCGPNCIFQNITIGKFANIAAMVRLGAIVMPGLTVGNGAGAVVTRDVAPWTIVAGNPARVIRRRFTPEVAEAMERIRWWDWSHEELRERMGDFEGNTEAFIHKYG